MSDIVERLRTIPRSGLPIGHTWNLCDDAADEIEKLRAAVQDLAKHIWRGDWDKLKPETRELLGEKN